MRKNAILLALIDLAVAGLWGKPIDRANFDRPEAKIVFLGLMGKYNPSFFDRRSVRVRAYPLDFIGEERFEWRDMDFLGTCNIFQLESVEKTACNSDLGSDIGIRNSDNRVSSHRFGYKWKRGRWHNSPLEAVSIVGNPLWVARLFPSKFIGFVWSNVPPYLGMKVPEESKFVAKVRDFITEAEFRIIRIGDVNSVNNDPRNHQPGSFAQFQLRGSSVRLLSDFLPLFISEISIDSSGSEGEPCANRKPYLHYIVLLVVFACVSFASFAYLLFGSKGDKLLILVIFPLQLICFVGIAYCTYQFFDVWSRCDQAGYSVAYLFDVTLNTIKGFSQ